MLNNNQFAIFLIIISIIFGTLMGTFIKLAQEELNVFTTGFLSFFFGFLIISPYILKTKFDYILKIVALIKRIVLFFITLIFIIILLVGATTSF